jgi:hypothetical protein
MQSERSISTKDGIDFTRQKIRAEAIADTFDYIKPFHNRRRRYSTLG